MKYAKHPFRLDALAFNGKEILQAGCNDINVTTDSTEEDFLKACFRGEYQPCDRKEFTEIYLKSSQAINQFIKEA